MLYAFSYGMSGVLKKTILRVFFYWRTKGNSRSSKETSADVKRRSSPSIECCAKG